MQRRNFRELDAAVADLAAPPPANLPDRNHSNLQPLTSLISSGVNGMSPDDCKRAYRKDLMLASALAAVAFAVFGLSSVQLGTRYQQLAQVTQPLQSTPGAETKPSAPAAPVTTGTRPSAIPPQPARPDAEAQKAGATPALPPAPAEKIAAPIKER
jgi:hypothetical protein